MSNLDEARNYIQNIDFSNIIWKMEYQHGWMQDDVIETCKQYCNFLFLKKKYIHNVLIPSEDVDIFWHEHILDTKKYMHDTNFIFGSYLHHHPSLKKNEDIFFISEDGQKKSEKSLVLFEKTQSLYLNEFGQEMTATRSRYPVLLYKIMYKFRKYI